MHIVCAAVLGGVTARPPFPQPRRLRQLMCNLTGKGAFRPAWFNNSSQTTQLHVSLTEHRTSQSDIVANWLSFHMFRLCCLQMEGSKAGAGSGERCSASPTSLTVRIWPWTYVGANQCVSCVWNMSPPCDFASSLILCFIHQGETTTASAWSSRSARSCFSSSAEAGLICGTTRPSWTIWYISKANLLNSYFKGDAV